MLAIGGEKQIVNVAGMRLLLGKKSFAPLYIPQGQARSMSLSHQLATVAEGEHRGILCIGVACIGIHCGGSRQRDCDGSAVGKVPAQEPTPFANRKQGGAFETQAQVVDRL